MTRRLYSLSVKPLYKESESGYQYNCLYPIPSFCFCDFNSELTSLIQELHQEVVMQGYTSISKRITSVTWFFQQTNRYHVNIPTSLHVLESEVFFTGHCRPYKEPYFQSNCVPVDEVLCAQGLFKPIDLARLILPLARGLTKELEAKQAEFERVSDRYYSLDKLLSELVSLDECIEPVMTNTKAFEESLSSDIAALSVQSESLEIELEALAKQFLRKLLGLNVGDWIYSDVAPNSGKRTQLKIEQVSFYNKHITLRGPIITQKGEVGKRQESIYMQVSSEDEH